MKEVVLLCFALGVTLEKGEYWKATVFLYNQLPVWWNRGCRALIRSTSDQQRTCSAHTPAAPWALDRNRRRRPICITDENCLYGNKLYSCCFYWKKKVDLNRGGSGLSSQPLSCIIQWSENYSQLLSGCVMRENVESDCLDSCYDARSSFMFLSAFN